MQNVSIDEMIMERNTTEEGNLSNDRFEKSSSDEQRIHVDHNHRHFKVPVPRMDKLHSNVDLKCPVGTKRKAEDDTNPRKDNSTLLKTGTSLQRKMELTTRKGTEVKTDALLSIRLGHGEPVRPRMNAGCSLMTSPRSWPMTVMDDLDHAPSSHSTIMYQELPHKRQRYQRRNSFLVRRDSSLTASSLSVLEDINRACFSETGVETVNKNKRPKNVLAFLKNSSFSSTADRTKAEQLMGQQQNDMLREDELYVEEISGSPLLPSKIKEMRTNDVTNLDTTAATAWGHASWSNSEDTKWYSAFSFLSFDSTEPILPPLARSETKNGQGASGDEEQGREAMMTAAAAMLPPPPHIQ